MYGSLSELVRSSHKKQLSQLIATGGILSKIPCKLTLFVLMIIDNNVFYFSVGELPELEGQNMLASPEVNVASTIWSSGKHEQLSCHQYKTPGIDDQEIVVDKNLSG